MNIDNNIPLPIRAKRKSKYAFIADMKVGDSFLTTTRRNLHNTRAYFSKVRMIVAPGIKMSYAQEGDSVRIWRRA